MVTSAVTAMIKTALRTGIPPSGLGQQGQRRGNQRHGGDQENVLPKEQQAKCRGCHADQGGEVMFGAEPLLHKDGDKEGGEDKVDAFVVDGNQISCQTAQGGTQYPVAVVQQGNCEAVAMAAHALRHLVLRNQGVSFVGQGEDQIGLFLSGTLVGIHHGDAVEKVAGIDHQGGQDSGQQTGAAGKEADSYILHGAGINEDAHSQRPPESVPVLLQQDAEAETQENVPGHDGQGVKE